MAESGHVTRDVEPAAVGDLQDAAARATVAFVDGDLIAVLPAHARGAGDATWFAIRTDGAPDLDGREVVLVRDDGDYWFELRCLSVRGRARRAPAAAAPQDAALAWYAVEPTRVLAWDYGSLRRT